MRKGAAAYDYARGTRTNFGSATTRTTGGRCCQNSIHATHGVSYAIESTFENELLISIIKTSIPRWHARLSVAEELVPFSSIELYVKPQAKWQRVLVDSVKLLIHTCLSFLDTQIPRSIELLLLYHENA